MKKNNPFNVAAYIRLSREDGDKAESDSIGNQRKLIHDYLRDKEDFILFDTYVDDGYTGTNFKRPAFQRMLEDIESGEVNCVIVKDLSRFGRDYIDTGKFLERYFPDNDVRFIAITDNIDSMKQAYDMLLPIKNIFNEQYARDISKKVHSAMQAKQKTGEFIGAFASWLQSYLMIFVTQGTLKHLRLKVFHKMQSLPVKYFDTHAHGDIMSVYTNDIDTMRQMISQSLTQLISSVVTIASVLTSMIILNVPLTLLTLSHSPT